MSHTEESRMYKDMLASMAAALHMEGGYLRNPALHDEEVRVVDVELHRVEEVLHPTAGNGQRANVSRYSLGSLYGI